MSHSADVDYGLFDRPDILRFLFYPRPEWNIPLKEDRILPLSIPIETDIVIGALFHASSRHAPTILFFHGNGEIAADYNDIAPIFTELEYNFLAVDYRGYGRSSGTPTVTAMMEDCHIVFSYGRQWLKDHGYTGPLVIMGRSLGSAPALELASRYQHLIDALVIDSGFAYIGPLLALLGISMASLGIEEEQGFRNLDKMKTVVVPSLVIHGQYDQVIAYGEGRALYEACAASEKKFLTIRGANHNNLFLVGMNDYRKAMAWLSERLGKADE